MERRSFIGGIVAACCAPLAAMRAVFRPVSSDATYVVDLLDAPIVGHSATLTIIDEDAEPQWTDGQCYHDFDFFWPLLKEKGA